MTRHSPQFDRFGLGTARGAPEVRIGDVDLGAAVLDGDLSSGMNNLPTATLSVDTTLLAGQPVDYFGLVKVTAPRATFGSTFNGNVVSAKPQSEGLELSCQTHPSLTESKVGRLESFACDPRELMYLMTRTGGLTEDQIDIGGIDDLPLEVVEVVIPLTGVAVSTPVRLGALSLLSPSSTMSLCAPFDEGEMYEVMQSADCHALYRQVSRRMLEVEQRAVRAVDVLLGWIATRARYGLAHLPHGAAQEFKRSDALSRPVRGDVVLSRGLESGRTWLRELTLHAPEGLIDVGSSSGQWTPPPPDALSTAQQMALVALRRATTDGDVLQRVQALWEAIEFYVAGVRPSRRFSKTEARRVRKAVPKDITPELRERVMGLLGKINDPPLMAKLREAADRDGVPITEAEMDLLHRVRGVRNSTAHGRKAEVPDVEDVDYAVSVVARLLLHGVSHSGHV